MFERVREEARAGLDPGSVAGGYGAAFSTILDANLTTVIAAILLAAFGTGPIQGFAITLTMGILTSMFTALLLTRLLINLWLDAFRPSSYRVREGGALMFPLIRLFPQDSKIDFLGLRRITLVLSLVLILGSVGMFFTRGLNLGIDFKGGLLFDLRFSEAISIVAVKDVLSALGYGTPEVQAFGSDRDAKVVFATPSAPTEDEEIAQVSAIKQAVRALSAQARR